MISRKSFKVIKNVQFLKKNFVYKEKSGTVTKVKLRKFRKHNQLYFQTLVLASYCYFGDNAQNTDFFRSTGFKESNDMVVTKSQSKAMIK